jgi:DNA-binding beta-propeller fold protein YncE
MHNRLWMALLIIGLLYSLILGACTLVAPSTTPTTGQTNGPTVETPVPKDVPIATRDPNYVPPATPWRPVPLPTASPAERDSAGDSWLYLGAFQNDFISVVDPISGHALHQVSVNADQAGLAVSPDGARLYIVDGLPIEQGQLRVFDTATWQVVHREPVLERSRLLGRNPIALSPDGRWLVVGFYSYERGEGWNRVFDTQGFEFVEEGWKLSGCGQTPLRLYGQASDSRVYVQCPGFVAQLRAENLSPLRHIPSPIPFEGGGPGSMQVGGPDLAVSPDGRRLYGLYPRIEHRAEGSLVPVVGTDLQLLVWETDKGERVQDVMMDQQVSVPLATGGRGGTGYLTVSQDGERIFVAWEDMLWALDGETLRVVQELRLPAPVDGMAQSVDGQELYLLPSSFGNLAVRMHGMFTVDAATLELVNHVDDWPRLTIPFFFTAPAPGQP